MRNASRLLAMALVLASVLIAAPADGGTKQSGLVFYVTSAPVKGVDGFAISMAQCPPGTFVVGTGVKVIDGPKRYEVSLVTFDPVEHQAFGGVRYDPAGRDATIRTTATCINDVLTNPTYGAASTPTTSTGVVVTAQCPNPSHSLVGGGAAVFGSTGRLTQSAPASALTGWSATGYGLPSTQVVARAACYHDVDYTVVPVAKAYQVEPRSTQKAVARCAGRDSAASGGFLAIDGNTVTSSAPYDSGDADKVPDDGWVVTFRNNSDALSQADVYVRCLAVSTF